MSRPFSWHLKHTGRWGAAGYLLCNEENNESSSFNFYWRSIGILASIIPKELLAVIDIPGSPQPQIFLQSTILNLDSERLVDIRDKSSILQRVNVNLVSVRIDMSNRVIGDGGIARPISISVIYANHVPLLEYKRSHNARKPLPSQVFWSYRVALMLELALYAFYAWL